MKKELKISLVDGFYVIESQDGKQLKVNTNDLTISATQLFEQFFFDCVYGKPVEIDVLSDEQTIVGMAEKKFVEKFREIINGICDQLNRVTRENESIETEAGEGSGI